MMTPFVLLRGRCAALPPASAEVERSRRGAGFVGMQFGTRIAVGPQTASSSFPDVSALPIGPGTGQLLAWNYRVRVFD
jgi:hypothetical protein